MQKPYTHTRDRSCPSKLFLEVTTRCNLRCQMCVKQSCDNGIVSGDMPISTLERLKPVLSHLDEVIISGIGEPLLHPQLETFIEKIKAELSSDGSVGLQTNGTLLSRSRIEHLLFVGIDTICISVDAATSELLATIRTGAQFDQLETALSMLNASKRSFCSAPSVGVQFVWKKKISRSGMFTWHQHASYPEGRKKIVQHLSFGDLESMSMIDIWEGDAFRSFRNSVLEYDFPYCGDCGLSPCDDIDRHVFEHDCYTNTVPCCDCPWPIGVLNCLQ